MRNAQSDGAGLEALLSDQNPLWEGTVKELGILKEVGGQRFLSAPKGFVVPRLKARLSIHGLNGARLGQPVEYFLQSNPNMHYFDDMIHLEMRMEATNEYGRRI